jgi:predicted amidophosphoribosyltransferase
MAAPSPERRLARLAGRVSVCLGDLVFLPGCLRCGGDSFRRRAGVCLECWSRVRPWRTTPGHCLRCGEDGCRRCEDAPPHWSWLEATLTYEDAGRELILLYKFGPHGGRRSLGRPLAALLAASLRVTGVGRDVDVVTAVPSHGSRVRERGFDAAWILACQAARRAGLSPPRALLWRLGGDAPRARAALPDAPAPAPEFRLRRAARERIAGKRVLLVDDVYTTGETLRRCAGLLAGAGAAEVRATVLARTPRRRFARSPSIE